MSVVSSEAHGTRTETSKMGEKQFIPQFVQEKGNSQIFSTCTQPYSNPNHTQHLLSRFLTSISRYLPKPFTTTASPSSSHIHGDDNIASTNPSQSSITRTTATCHVLKSHPHHTNMTQHTDKMKPSAQTEQQCENGDTRIKRKESQTFDVLPDDVVRSIFHYALDPILVNGRARFTNASIKTAASLAAVHPRFHTILHALLTDIDLSKPQSQLQFNPQHLPSSSSAPSLSFPPSIAVMENESEDEDELRAIRRIGGTTVRRLYLRRRADKPSALLPTIQSCTHLKTLDLSFHSAVTDNLLNSLISTTTATSSKTMSMTYSLQTLLLRGCRALTSAVLVQFITHFRRLVVVDISAISAVTDATVEQIVAAHVRSLRIFAVSHCPRVTDLSLHFFSRLLPAHIASITAGDKNHNRVETVRTIKVSLRLDALFLRSTCVSDDGIKSMLCNQALANSLQTVDLVDCPRITNRSFAALHRACPAIRERINAYNGISTNRPPLSNALLLLDNYIMPITSNHPQTHAQRSTTCVVLADAATAPALEATLLVHRTLTLHHEECRLLTNTTLPPPPSPSPTTSSFRPSPLRHTLSPSQSQQSQPNHDHDDVGHAMYAKFGIHL